jgi:hypothetical protein
MPAVKLCYVVLKAFGAVSHLRPGLPRPRAGIDRNCGKHVRGIDEEYAPGEIRTARTYGLCPRLRIRP